MLARFCDGCGMVISNNTQYDVITHNNARTERTYQYVFCPYCSVEVREKLAHLERWGIEDLKEKK